MRVLVCGGRDYGYIPPGVARYTSSWIIARDNASLERRTLDATLDTIKHFSVLIHGAARGADELAQMWAKRHGIKESPFPANWYPNGRSGGLDKSAGPIRNQRMIDEGKPELVVAFPGGKGTADMVKRARAAGIKVIEITPPAPRATQEDRE